MDPIIVVIDPSKLTCSYLRTALTREGYQVWTFQDPVIALQAVYRDKQVPVPNCWILELSLPNWNGNDVIRYIRVLRKGVMPIIVFTNQRSFSDRMLPRLAKAEYLMKPFDREVMVNLVNRLVPRQTDQ